VQNWVRSQVRKRAEITLGPGLWSIGIKEGVKCARDKIIVNNKIDRNNRWPGYGMWEFHTLPRVVFSTHCLSLVSSLSLTTNHYIQLSSAQRSMPCHFLPPDIPCYIIPHPNRHPLGLSMSHAACNLPTLNPSTFNCQFVIP
jgi:hypothetical protein